MILYYKRNDKGEKELNTFITNSKEETVALAKKVAEKLNNHDVIF